MFGYSPVSPKARILRVLGHSTHKALHTLFKEPSQEEGLGPTRRLGPDDRGPKDHIDEQEGSYQSNGFWNLLSWA